MDASKVTISQELLNSKALSPGKKMRLRREAIFAYIRNKPAGTKIGISELANVAHMNYSAGSQLVYRMIRGGELIAENTRKFKKEYSIPGDAQQVQPPKPKIPNYPSAFEGVSSSKTKFSATLRIRTEGEFTTANRITIDLVDVDFNKLKEALDTGLENAKRLLG